MIKSIYLQTLEILKKIPVKLWGLSLLNALLILLVSFLGGVPIIAVPIAAALEAGMIAIYYSAYKNGGKAETKTMFKPFEDWKTFKRIAGGMCWKSLWVILWFLIPIAGPFIAIYKSLQYAFTPYILNEEPEVSALEALRKSKEDTNGYKSKMFIATVLPSVAFTVVSIILSALGLIPYAGILFTIINVIISIVWVLVAPLFFGLVQAGFYDFGKKPVKKAAPVIPAAPAAENTAENAPVSSPVENVTSTPAVNTCPTCGTENSVEKKFCTKCGAKL